MCYKKLVYSFIYRGVLPHDRKRQNPAHTFLPQGRLSVEAESRGPGPYTLRIAVGEKSQSSGGA